MDTVYFFIGITLGALASLAGVDKPWYIKIMFLFIALVLAYNIPTFFENYIL